MRTGKIHIRNLWHGSLQKYVELNAEINPQITPIVNDFKSRALKGEIANFNTEWSQYIDQLFGRIAKLIDEIFNNPNTKNSIR